MRRWPNGGLRPCRWTRRCSRSYSAPTELRELLDADAIASVERELQRLEPDRQVAGLGAVHDLVRTIGDLTTDEAIARGATSHDLADLETQRRLIRVRIAGEQRWAAIEDSGRLRDALGTALPVGVPEIFTEPVRDPLGDLVSRYARTHGPFVPDDVAQRLGLGNAVVAGTLERLRGRLVQGEFRPAHSGSEWCDAEVLRLIRRRSLAALRKEVEPVEADVLARFVPAWQGIGGRAASLRGVDGVLRVVEQLAGAPLAASALETVILPSRVADYTPAMLDELTLSGEVMWAGSGAIGSADGWIVLAPSDLAPLLLPEVTDPGGDEIQRLVLATVTGDQALFFRAIADQVRAALAAASDDRSAPLDADLVTAMWDLVWSGALTNDTLAPVRALLDGPTRAAHPRRPRAARARYGRYAGLGASPSTASAAGRPRSGPPAMSGRWSQLPARESEPTARAVAAADALLDRYGIVTRGVVVAERLPGGFSAVYPVLRAAEEAGRTRRGYFVEGLGAAQFALPGAVDRLRARTPAPSADAAIPTLVLAATDPANPFGAALPWPPAQPPPGAEVGRRGHLPARKAGALVVVVDGRCVIYVERGGRTLLSFTDDAADLQPAADALALAVHDGLLGKLAIERADGAPITSSALGGALEAAGFRPTPRGLRLRR